MTTSTTSGKSGFLDDPFASVSAQFALAAPAMTPPSVDRPSEVGLRPWGLRDLRSSSEAPASVPEGRYSGELQMFVDRAGLPLIAGERMDVPTAKTTSKVDGEDGPSSEDWKNDFCGDDPFQL